MNAHGEKVSSPACVWQRRVHVYLLLQEPAKFQPSLIDMPTPACASSLGAGSDPQSGRLSVPSSTSTAGPSPEALHPTPTHRPQPMQPPGLLHVPRAGPAHVWQGCFGAGSAPWWVSAGKAGRPAEATASPDSYRRIAQG